MAAPVSRSGWKWTVGAGVLSLMAIGSLLHGLRVRPSSGPDPEPVLGQGSGTAEEEGEARVPGPPWNAGTQRRVFEPLPPRSHPPASREPERPSVPQRKPAPRSSPVPSVPLPPVWPRPFPVLQDSPSPTPVGDAGKEGVPEGYAGGLPPAGPEEAPSDRARVAITGVIRTSRGVRVLVEDLGSGQGELVAPGEEVFGYRVAQVDERQGTAVLERGKQVHQVQLGENKLRKEPSPASSSEGSSGPGATGPPSPDRGPGVVRSQTIGPPMEEGPAEPLAAGEGEVSGP